MSARGSNAWRLAAWGEPCAVPLVAVPIYAGGPRFQAHALARDAFVRLGAVFLRHRYIVHSAGCYNCRPITGGRAYSSHAWGISVDINPGPNPYIAGRLVTDMPAAMIRDVMQIKTADGVPVFRWGGDWDNRPETDHRFFDAMHFEIIATPDELRAGFVLGAPSSTTGDRPAAIDFPVIRRGARGPIVLILQRLLGLRSTTGAGEFGPRTDEAVRIYQRSRGLAADGVVGAATWTALTSHLPPLAAGAVPPQKVIP